MPIHITTLFLNKTKYFFVFVLWTPQTKVNQNNCLKIYTHKRFIITLVNYANLPLPSVSVVHHVVINNRTALGENNS